MALWALVSLFSTFALPQLLGVLLYFRLVRFSRWLAFALGVLTPGVLFFFLGPLFFFAGFPEAAARGELTCGTPAVFAAMMVLAGTVIELVCGLIVQFFLFVKRK